MSLCFKVAMHRRFFKSYTPCYHRFTDLYPTQLSVPEYPPSPTAARTKIETRMIIAMTAVHDRETTISPRRMPRLVSASPPLRSSVSSTLSETLFFDIP